jgi:SAM-dependent methyltransferase
VEQNAADCAITRSGVVTLNLRKDRAILESGRAWWNVTSRREGTPLALDGYGRAATAGGEALQQALTDDIGQKLEVSGQVTLLEVGCGAGAIAQGLAPRCRQTIGVDFSFGMVCRVRHLQLPHSAFCVGEAYCLPFSAGVFDRVLCYAVFNNFPSLEYAQGVIDELIRVAKPGGIVLIGQVPNAASKEEWIRAYAARFGGGRSPHPLRRWLGDRKRALMHLLYAGVLAVGKRPPASLNVIYYETAFFQQALRGDRHTCEIVPAFDLLREQSAQASNRLYRFDVRIRVA